MAHPADLEKLREGPAAWNSWRQEDPDHIPDLRDAELPLNQRQFGPGNGGPINLSDADMQGIVLRNSTLSEASFVRANVAAADLVQARLDGADLTGADLTDAMLDYADLTGANLNGTILVGASLVNVTGMTQDQISRAHGDASTALPAYLLPPENWFPSFDGDIFGDYMPETDLSPLSNDPYDVLGVDRDATFDEIRASFRTLVKRLHPDLNPDDAAAQERFKRVSIAYRILGDPVKRDRYNRGEIDANGDVRPEFEARKEFRRYAFRYYAAAAASLFLAVGILAAVWYAFWTQDLSNPGTTQTASEDAAPKQTERLIALQPQTGAASSGETSEPAVKPSQIAAVTTAIREAGVYGGAEEAGASLQSAPASEDAGDSVAEAAALGASPARKDPDTKQTTVASLGNGQPSAPAETGQTGEEPVRRLATLGNPDYADVAETSTDLEKNAAAKAEADKLFTLFKDEGLVESARPMSVFIPVFAAAHGEIFGARLTGTSIVSDTASQQFRNSFLERIGLTEETHMARTIDSLQVLREEDGFGIDFTALANELADMAEPDTGFALKDNAAALFLTELPPGSITEETAAIETKTAAPVAEDPPSGLPR